MMDYLIIFVRALLRGYNLSGVENYNEVVKTDTAYEILSEYFDLSYIKKEKYYFFEETVHFIYEN